VHIGHRPNHLILYVSLSFSHLFPKLCDLTWYQSYKLMPAFDQVPFFFFLLFIHPFSYSIKTKIKMPTNIYRVPIFFLEFSHPIPKLLQFSSHTHVSLSLSKWHVALPLFPLPTNTTYPILSC
jgi:hypothetical protein